MSTTPDAPRARALPVLVGAVAAAVVMGALIAIQSRLNGELGQRLGDGIVAALISFGTGWVILAAGMLAVPSGRAGLRRVLGEVRSRRIPWWYLGGGAAGAFLVISQGVAEAALGVALFTVGAACGQTVSASIVDRVGLGTLRAQPLRPARVVGTLLAIAAVVFAVSANIRGDVPIALLLLPFAAGVGVGWQQAVNGQVGHHAGSVLTATFVNFTVGTAVLLLASVVAVLVAGPPRPPPTTWWVYLGGPVGVVFIGGAAVIVHRTGVLLLGLATIAGQLVASVVIELVLPGGGIAPTTLLGTAAALVAVGVAATPSLRDARIRPDAG